MDGSQIVDTDWDAVFRGQQWGAYPELELVRFMARNYYHLTPIQRGETRILEIGCGAGANLWYLDAEGFCGHGLDVSGEALKQCKANLQRRGAYAELTKGSALDILALYQSGPQFDAIVDIGCLTHIPLELGDEIIADAKKLLKPGGKFFAAELIAVGCWGYGTGDEILPRMFGHISEGPLQNRPAVQFRNLDDVRTSFAPFETVKIERAVRTYENGAHEYARWIVEATKAALP